jgi:transposase
MLLGWDIEAISKECHVAVRTVYRIQSNLLRHGSIRPPQFRQLGRARKLSSADEEALLHYLLREGWQQQQEMVWWLYHERDVLVNCSTVSRMLKRRGWSRKELRRISQARSKDLRQSYLDDIRQFAAEDLVFIDESIFNEKTGWRHYAYAPIGDEARYNADIQRGRTWSICAAMTLDDWLPCTGIKQGYYSTADFCLWLQTYLLPAINTHGNGRPMVVVMDNVSIHTSQDITQMVEDAGHLIRFLPPYSPDYNPIELTFSVLKAWMKRNWVFYRHTCGSYGSFLELAIQYSRCGRHARQQFKHAAGNGVYIEAKTLMDFQQFLRRFEDEDTGEVRLISPK